MTRFERHGTGNVTVRDGKREGKLSSLVDSLMSLDIGNNFAIE